MLEFLFTVRFSRGSLNTTQNAVKKTFVKINFVENSVCG